MAANHKRPAFNKQVAAAKQAAKVADPNAYIKEQPSWRLDLLELADPFGWHVLSLHEARSIQQRLASFESMTWGEILHPTGRRSSPNHLIQVDVLCPPAQARLAQIAPDIDVLVSLRVSQAERIFGILDRHICRLVFWDPCHQVYPINIADN